MPKHREQANSAPPPPVFSTPRRTPEMIANPANWVNVVSYGHPMEKSYVGPGPWDDEAQSEASHLVKLRYSDLQVMIRDEEGDVANDILSHVPRLGRLHGVLQLAAKSIMDTGDQSAKPPEERDDQLPFPHTRFAHTIQVLGVGLAILQQNGIGPEDKLTKLYTAAALLHDIATPAFGDSVKPIDRDALDEEAHWHKMIGPDGWKYIESLGLTRVEIDEAIHNKGVAGQLLDIADRIAYVTEDAFQMVGTPEAAKKDSARSPIEKCVVAAPDIGNIYKNIRIKDGQVYCDSPEKLTQFLKLRSELFNSAYMFPPNNFRDVMLRELVAPLYPHVLSADDLRLLDDKMLLQVLNDIYHTPLTNLTLFYAIGFWTPALREVASKKEMDASIKSLRRSGKYVVGSTEPYGYSPGTKVLVESGGKIQAASLAFPDLDTEIRQRSAALRSKMQVFYIDPSSREITVQSLLRLVQAAHVYEGSKTVERNGASGGKGTIYRTPRSAILEKHRAELAALDH